MCESNLICQLENRCKNLCVEIEAISGAYSKIGIESEPVAKEVRRLKSRAKEYEHGAFIAIVVGPAKSGKSTFVNLIAGAFVSPTNFLECTVRPSIISKKATDQEGGITCYTSDYTDDKIDKIDSIIDCIRGLEKESELQNIKIEKYPLTEEVIRKKVELGLEESLTSDTLVTSIKTPGGSLLQDNIFLIDMPGFDGAYKNIDDPAYDAIAQRADLIIFVQSSNAAFSKVSKDFLKILFDKNKDVPVCLIHNQFDASWWKSKEEKERQIESQMRFAVNEIRKSGFIISDENCYTLNLGAVQDFKAGYFEDNALMNEEAKKYATAEIELYERIVSRKDAIRLANCLSRTVQQANRLYELLTNEIAKRKGSIDEYNRIKDIFNKIDYQLTSDSVISVNADQIKLLFEQYEHQALEEFSNDSIKYSNDDAHDRLSAFIDRVNNGFNDNLNAILNITFLENSIYNDYRDKASSIREKLIDKLTSAMPDIPLNRIMMDLATDADIRTYVDLKTIVPVKKRFAIPALGRHSAEDMRKYVADIVNRLTTMRDHIGQSTNFGYVFKDILPLIEAKMGLRVNEMKIEYQKRLTEYIFTTCKKILSAIISNYESYVSKTDELISLSEKLIKICK